MPELPEVETIKRGLQQTIVGLTINDVEVLHHKSFPVEAELVDEFVIGSRVTSLDRRAKVLIIHLSSNHSLLFHLKMTGQMVLVDGDGSRKAGGHPTPSMAGGLPDKSTKVIFRFSPFVIASAISKSSLSESRTERSLTSGNHRIKMTDATKGSTLYFNDQRIFGWIKLVPTAEVPNDSLIMRLGPEPMTNDFTLAGLKKVLARRGGSAIKAVILDQSTVAGIGNIYADESLHLAKIHPATLTRHLSTAQIKRLYEAIKTIIALGIQYGGTSFSHYVNSLGGTGDYFENARVFRRQGLTCPVCGTVIIKTRVAGRGTHLCPRCQKMPIPTSLRGV